MPGLTSATTPTITLILILILGFWLINMTIVFVMNRINSVIALPGYKK